MQKNIVGLTGTIYCAVCHFYLLHPINSFSAWDQLFSRESRLLISCLKSRISANAILMRRWFYAQILHEPQQALCQGASAGQGNNFVFSFPHLKVIHLRPDPFASCTRQLLKLMENRGGLARGRNQVTTQKTIQNGCRPSVSVEIDFCWI